MMVQNVVWQEKSPFKLCNRYFQAIHKLQWTHLTGFHKSVTNPAMCALSVLSFLLEHPSDMIYSQDSAITCSSVCFKGSSNLQHVHHHQLQPKGLPCCSNSLEKHKNPALPIHWICEIILLLQNTISREKYVLQKEYYNKSLNAVFMSFGY